MNKIALITGSTRGIGKEIAIELLQNGYFVILNGTHKSEDIIGLINEFNQFEGKFDYYKFDVTNREEVTDSINKIIEKYSRVDVLVNNAGIIKDKTLIKLDFDMWDDVINVNLTGAFNLCKCIIPNMIENKFGRVINISSVIGLSGNYGQSNYAASKAGLIGFTKSLALETAKYGITINAIAPGYIRTDMTNNLSQNIVESIENKIPVKSFGTPRDVADLIIFLSKDETKYITGETISVNGGLYLK